MKILILIYKLRRLYSINNRDGQIEYVCGLAGRYFMFDDLYDYLIEKGFKIDFDKEIKQLLWQSAKSESIINNEREYLKSKFRFEDEYVKKYAERLYKSELVYLYLVTEYNKGNVLTIKAETPIPCENKDQETAIKRYLEQKTLQLTA